MELSESELARERKEGSVLKQMRRNSKIEETKLIEEKRKATDLQRDFQKVTDELSTLKIQVAKDSSSVTRETESLKEEIASVRSQKENLEGQPYLTLLLLL